VESKLAAAEGDVASLRQEVIQLKARMGTDVSAQPGASAGNGNSGFQVRHRFERDLEVGIQPLTPVISVSRQPSPDCGKW
jgi:hypothetical protein